MKVANAPLSYGAFEMTVGTDFPVPDPALVLDAMAAAGYAGTELGPPGYLGDEDLRGAGDWSAASSRSPSPIRTRASTSCTRRWICSATHARARPGAVRRGRAGAGRQPGRAAARTRRCGSTTRAGSSSSRASSAPPTPPASAASSRSSTTTRRPTSRASRRSSACSSTPTSPLLLDCAHLLVAGGDPLQALRDWGERIEAIHIKDVRLDVLAGVKAERADTLTAWRRGLFCALGRGRRRPRRFCAAVEAIGYDGWVVVEQDRVLPSQADFERAAADQVAQPPLAAGARGW